uniref:Uncharacterized protein n=1 Tax=Triticum urartu TaxID=4572 RepID=A0A8R7QYX5_TRIUA
MTFQNIFKTHFKIQEHMLPCVKTPLYTYFLPFSFSFFEQSTIGVIQIHEHTLIHMNTHSHTLPL